MSWKMVFHTLKAIPNVTNTSLLVIAAPVTEQAVQPKEIEAKNYLDNTADWVCLKDQTLVDDALHHARRYCHQQPLWK